MSCSDAVDSEPLMNQAAPPQARPLSNILVATDFSSASNTALEYGLSLARRFGATLYLAHIVSEGSGTEQAWRDGQHLTTDLLISGKLRGVPHKLLVGQGEIWAGLAPIVEEHKIDMIVVGTHGRTGLAKVILGSVAERIFRQASCPVLTVGPNSRAYPPPGGLCSILYATDFTPQSLRASDYAFSLALRSQAHLILLHAMNPSSKPDEQSALANDARNRLKAIIPDGLSFHDEPECLVISGVAGSGILSVAAEKNPDLIVLGVTKAGADTFAGRRWTNASEVIGKSACPVLTVR